MNSWYFAYGSNLWTEQMIARTGAIGDPGQAPRIARLEGFRLVFQRLEVSEPAFANIISPGQGVLGVVYRCRPADLEKLDRFERGYERQPILVTDLQGEVLEAAAYIIQPALVRNYGSPSAEYLQRIITGARQHGLPERYVGEIIGIAAANQI